MNVQGTSQKAAGLAGAIAGGTTGGLGAVAGVAGANFGSYLADAQTKAQASNTQSQQESRKAAEGLVSNALILPMLKQLRHSTFNQKGIFAAGNGEKAFGPEFDMQIADRIAQSPRMTVTASLTQRLAAKHVSKAKPTRSLGVDVRG